jgi:hypothetical protein
MQKLNSAAMLTRFATFFKAVPNEKLADIADALDQWNEPDGQHKNPSRAQIVTGPAERASGDGAVKMVGEYSRVVPQQGLTGQYGEFQAMLDSWAKSFTGQLNPILAKHDQAIGAIVGMFSHMQKAAPAEDTFIGKALVKLAKAKVALRKADLADEGEADERSRQIAVATELLAAAKRLLAKASEDEDDPVDDDEIEKALSTLRALTKAVAGAKDEKAEGEDGEEKNKGADKAASKKAAVTLEDVQKSLAGLAVLPTTIAGLMDAIMGKSRNPEPPIMMAKSGNVIDFAERIEQAAEDGRLSGLGEVRATTLLQHLKMAEAGRVSMRDVEIEIAKSPAEVRALFAA